MGMPSPTLAVDSAKVTVKPIPASPLDREEYTAIQLGVWRVLLPKEPRAAGSRLSPAWDWLMNKCRTAALAYSLVLRFLADVYRLNPLLVVFYISLKILNGVQCVLLLYASSRLLQIMEVGLREGRVDAGAVLRALVARLLCTVIFATTKWAGEYTSGMLQSRVNLFFEEYVLQAKLRLDMPTSTDNRSKSQANPEEAWFCFIVVCEVFERVIALGSQLLFVAQQRTGGFMFTLLALVHPILNVTAAKTLYLKPQVVYADNKAYLRLRALQSMSQDKYRSDIVSGDLAGWVASEYRRARDSLGLVLCQETWAQYSIERTPLPKVFADLVGQLTTVYWVFSAFMSPGQLSMSSIAMLQQYAASLDSSLLTLCWEFNQLGKWVKNIKLLYETGDVKNQIVDGNCEYPRPEVDTLKGMEIDLRNVSFAYPGEKVNSNALKCVSLRIPAGALVVIVGENGSGKSTLIKLLARMYDAESGTIFVDGVSIQSYRLVALRRAQAHLAQEHKLFPLSLAENIRLGHPGAVDDEKMVAQAARDGGAAGLLGRLKEGKETVLEPVSTAYGYMLDDGKHKALKAVLAKLERPAEVSGGEKQRLIASRTFMRLNSGKIRLLCVDEPSSALDPKAEYELFQCLRGTGEGITKIFVTHRFGHLTKHADLVVCMKEGRVAETGTHRELMMRNGEYASLYNVQARAFTES